jgi:transcriptional regulator with XRE-family HTH domain
MSSIIRDDHASDAINSSVDGLYSRAMKARSAPKPQRRRTFLREWREHRELTQEQAAERLDLTQGQLSRIENGQSPYNQDFLEAAAYAYQCDVADLLMRNPLNADAMWSIVDQLRKATPEERDAVKRVTEALIQKAG